MQYAIGDKVRLRDWPGTVFEVRRVKEGRGYKLRVADTGQKYSFWWDDEEVFAAEPASKFKIGDRVVVNKDDHFGGYDSGDIVTVLGVAGEVVSFHDRDGALRSLSFYSVSPAPGEIDGTIYGASFYTSYGGKIAGGRIYGDKTGRFADGDLVRTDAIVEDLPDNVIRTRIGTYKLVFGPAAPERKFKPGDWVKTADGTFGIVYYDDGDPEDLDPYHVGAISDGMTGFYSADELVPHLPS